jgi:hypothetical protein
LPFLVSKYREWVDFDEYLVLKKENVWTFETEGKLAIKLSKRGNDVYAARIQKRVDALLELADKYGSTPAVSSDKWTHVLEMDLTYDPNLCSRDQAWIRIGEEYNRFIQACRGRYGKIQAVRTWEAFKNGYPHVHALLVFEDYAWRVFQYHGKLRIRGKHELENLWHSFIDVQSPYDLEGAIGYAVKHVMKVHSREVSLEYGHDDVGDYSHHDLTLALLWLFRKRAFSISGRMGKTLYDLIKRKHNSNVRLVQIDILDEEPVSEWVVLGFSTPGELGLSGVPWSVRLV